uniref:RRM domain-containing protein n=1 Tax=Kalanchoe fedtschenkoi TaxID=63787 RepID=A0A7N0URG5_KALFE
MKQFFKLLSSSIQSHAHLQFRRRFSAKLFVKGFTFRTTEEDLSRAFAEFGEVTEARVIRDKDQKSKGYGYVTFSSLSDADDALVAMNGKLLEGRSIYVDHVKPNPYISRGVPFATGPPTQAGVPKTRSRTEKPKPESSDPDPEPIKIRTWSA